jgi:hypothetical protein
MVGSFEEVGWTWLAPFSNESKLALDASPVVQVTRRAIRFWIRRFLRTKNANAHNASTTIMTAAAMAPPEIPDDLFEPPEPSRTRSGSTGEDIEGGEVVVSCAALFGAGTVGVEVEVDGREDDDGAVDGDGDEDEGIMSAVFVTAGRVE